MTEDRPLECNECKKKITVCYTEIIGDSINSFSMCKNCPSLQRHLHGDHVSTSYKKSKKDKGTGLCCGTCNTSLESIRMGSFLGCPDCYSVFSDILIHERLHKRSSEKKHSLKQLHVGRSPDENIEIHPSARLLALNEALNETLAREEYEQAAWLRDQINAITGNANEHS